MRSNNRIVVPEAKDAMNKFKMEAANEVGVDLKQGYNGHLTSRETGSVGGQTRHLPAHQPDTRELSPTTPARSSA